MNQEDNPYRSPQEQGPESDGIFSVAWKFLTSKKAEALHFIGGGAVTGLALEVVVKAIIVTGGPLGAGVLAGAMGGAFMYALYKALRARK